MKDHIPGISTLGAIVLISGIVGIAPWIGVSCSTQGAPARLPEKAQKAPEPVAPPSFQKWINHFGYAGQYHWTCRKTVEGEPEGHYCTLHGELGHIWTLYCSEKHCDLVTLVHEVKWSKTIPNPGFSSPIFSKE